MTLDEIQDKYIKSNDATMFQWLYDNDIPDSDIIRSLGIDVKKAFYEWIKRTQS